MAFPEQSQLQQASAAGDATAELRDRLAQFGRQIEQLRQGLPGDQMEALARIEHGIAYLAERVAAIARDRPARGAGETIPALLAAADIDEPWDAESAEALMRAWETAQAECAGSPRPVRHATRDMPGEAPAAGDHQAWLDGRLAGMSAMLQQALADMNPVRSLAALDRRLDQFERRLDAALSDMASPAEGDRLGRLETHVGELAAHLEAACRQLERLDAMDGQLRDLTQSLRDRAPETGPPSAHLSEDDLATIIDTAAERAVSRLAGELPGVGVHPTPDAPDRIASLEGLLKDYMTERRRSNEVTGGILYTIEGALTRLAGRVDAVEAANPGPLSTSACDADESDGFELERERLAEAYAAGARALGREQPDATLDAADYVAPAFQEDFGSAAEAECGAFPAPAPNAPRVPEARARQDLRASVMRAKLKAQTLQPAAATDDLDATTLGLPGDQRPRKPERRGSRRSGLMLAVGMALMCGSGFMLVDGLLTSPPAAPGHRQGPHEGLNPAAGIDAGAGRAQPVSVSEPAAPLAEPSERPEAEPAKPGPPGSSAEPDPATAPLHQSSSSPQAPEALSDQNGGLPASPPAPEQPPALEPAGLPSRDAAVLPPLPSTFGTDDLRRAAAGGGAKAQLDVATRHAEGNGVARDPALAMPG
jgi:localization factor PodJL